MLCCVPAQPEPTIASTTTQSLGAHYLRLVRDRRANPATVSQMVEAWLSYCKHTFAQRIGSSTFTNAREAVRAVLELFGDLPLERLSIDHLEAVRERMIDAGLARSTINYRMVRIRRMLRHFQHCLPEKISDLALPGLRKGRSAAKEAKRIYAVTIRDVLRTLKDPKLHPHVKAMCLVQLRTGIRPGEVCTLKGSEIDTTCSPWVCRPEEWKGSWREKDRVIGIGPRAQLILLPYLTDGFLFTPNRRKHLHGKPWQVCSYCRALTDAQERMGVPHWTPQQLRKRALTDAPTEELARQIAQHDDVRTTRKSYLDPVLSADVAAWAVETG